MVDPVTFDASSPRFALPLLFQGQSQKEVFVNEAFARTDALLHCTIEGTAAMPPVDPSDGTNWIVAPSASGAWADQEGYLACRQAGQWIFIAPRIGLRVFDSSTGQEQVYDGAWKKASFVQEPNGGTVVDSEARATVVQIISALQALGILPAS